ncbi:unnamed protein product [Ostreobium quekettii]|uniref:Alpha-taxilin n=1 Tax=Ostreobium quekettii TaxID=121088 RepID=A0A8S1JF88_9CHLO|nr:unnamed protein product [Ostreobium quekettii]|eukprot:evm.model.scf_164.1 EVM.evm.TU.scf_164.1   scf_164:858-6387(+)
MSSDAEPRGGAAGARHKSDDSHRHGGAAPQEASHPSGSKPQSDRGLQNQILASLQSKINELEAVVEEAGAEEREVAKKRKKLVREAHKMMASREASQQEKLNFMHNKFLEQVSERGRLERDHVTMQKELDRASRERDAAQQELKKVNLIRDKLEELCRTLQRENKAVLEEVRLRTEHEAESRRQLSERFQSTLKDVGMQLEQQGEQAEKSIRENVALREKLHEFTSILETIKQEHQKEMQAKELQIQLLEAEHEQAKLQVEEQGAIAKAEKERGDALENAKNMLATNMVTCCDRFEEMSKALEKLKGSLDTSEKARKRFMKENEEMKKKCNKADLTIIQLLDERTNLKKQVEKFNVKLAAAVDPFVHTKLKAQKEGLENLCRTLHKDLQLARGNKEGEGEELQLAGDGALGEAEAAGAPADLPLDGPKD